MAHALPQLACSVREATSVLGLGRTTIYKLINSGKLEVVKVGRRTLITTKSLHEFVGGHANA